MCGCVLSELDGDKVLIPGFVEGVEVVFQGGEDRVVGTFGEALGSGVVGSRRTDLSTAWGHKRSPELARKDRASVSMHC